MVFTGIVSALLISPLLDRTNTHILGLKISSALIAALCTILPFVPQTHSVPALFLTFGLIGISVFLIQPALLETQAKWTHPVSPEFSSFICWSGAKVVAAAFTVVVGNVLVLDEPKSGQPEGSLFYGRLFVAIMCWGTVPCLFDDGGSEG